MEEACGKRDGNSKEDQESSGNGDKRPAGIAAPREEWEGFVGAVEDKGDEDDPQYPTQSQAFYAVPASRGRCQHRRWEPGKLHSGLRAKKELRLGRNSPSFDAATGRRTNQGSVSPAYGYVSLALVKCSNEGGPGPRYNRKEVPGSSTLTMLVGHGYHLYLMPLFSEAGDWTTSVDPLPPPQTNLGKAPPLPLQVHTCAAKAFLYCPTMN